MTKDIAIDDKLDATFGKNRSFLLYFFDDQKPNLKAALAHARIIGPNKLSYKESLLFVCTSENMNIAMQAKYPTLPVNMIKDTKTGNMVPQKSFFSQDLILACENHFSKPDKLTTLPEEIIHNISWNIAFPGCFFSVNKRVSTISVKSILINKPNLPLDFINNFYHICPKIISYIEKDYLAIHKKHCNGINWLEDFGFKRAMAFKILFETPIEKPPLPKYNADFPTLAFKLFGLYVLLAEKNGQNLKQAVSSRIPKETLPYLKDFVLDHYQLTENGLAKAMTDFIYNRDLVRYQDYFMITDPNEVNKGKFFFSLFKDVQNKLIKKKYSFRTLEDEKLAESEPRQNCIIS